MKTTLRYAAFAVFFALFTLPLPIYAKAKANAPATAKKAVPATYTVSFNSNGGKGKMSSQKFTVNKSDNLALNRFSRKGYVFIGWSTSKTGAVSLQNGQSVKNLAKGGKTITLYAQWAVQNYLVAFFANGGSGSMPLQKHTYGKAAKLTANKFTRKGYSFQGWAKSSTGALKYRDMASVKNLTKKGSTIKLYALWKANPGSSSTTASTSSSSTSALPGDAVSFSKLQWVYGGFDGAAAKLSGKARISGLKTSNSGLSYSWASGGCQDLGASSATDASCVACVFCLSGGKWTGGKVDWICTNNKSLSFKNIKANYKGWSSAVLAKAEKYAFVILSKDGKSRTNVICVKAPGDTSSTTVTTATTAATPAATATTSAASATTTSAASTSSALPGDAVSFAQLQWVYGGFNGAAAKLSGKARISDLKASNSGLSYSWASGGCQDLGASSATDASCVACVFCLSGGKWTGGKVDWICTNNKSPSFKNIKDNYKGWSSDVLSKAEEYAFVILSKDGKTRTNVICVKSPGFSNASAPVATKTPATSTSTTGATSSADEVNFSLLQWTYGSFKGGDAKLGAQPRISGLKVNNSGMSYSWVSGGCENLGASSSSDASCVACLFCYSGGKWVGGKFDWVSTSRRTRDFKNIHEGYHGWSPTVFKNATAYAFVIVSKDGKSRSNVIRCGR